MIKPKNEFKKPEIPNKPFASYKWRWAVLTPTESLNSPPVYLGILRALHECEGLRFSSEKINSKLKRIQDDTDLTVNLVRTKDRNIFRNSQQYWKALGLLVSGERNGQICLSAFGKELAEGEITQAEFAITTLKTLTLPNRNIESQISDWEKTGIRIKPLELILNILIGLYEKCGEEYAFLTPKELRLVIIPLAGNQVEIDVHVDAIWFYRQGTLDVSKWPNCAIESNDKRMVREFLLFFSNYNLCNKKKSKSNEDEKYLLNPKAIDAFKELSDTVFKSKKLEVVTSDIRSTHVPEEIEREKVLREVTQRLGQTKFRKDILNAFGSKCMITGVTLDTVLEAAHIKPVSNNGVDDISNGLCLRSDIHTLFDRKHLRLQPDGQIILTKYASAKNNYEALPKVISIPEFVNLKFVKWRYDYC
jgi:hypothetical protein